MYFSLPPTGFLVIGRTCLRFYEYIISIFFFFFERKRRWKYFGALVDNFDFEVFFFWVSFKLHTFRICFARGRIIKMYIREKKGGHEIIIQNKKHLSAKFFDGRFRKDENNVTPVFRGRGRWSNMNFL